MKVTRIELRPDLLEAVTATVMKERTTLVDIVQLGRIELAVRIEVGPAAHIVAHPIRVERRGMARDAAVRCGDVTAVIRIGTLEEALPSPLELVRSHPRLFIAVLPDLQGFEKPDDCFIVIALEPVGSEEELRCPGPFLPEQVRVLPGPFERLRLGDAPQGVIGVKVWIFKGEIFDKPEAVPAEPAEAASGARS